MTKHSTAHVCEWVYVCVCVGLCVCMCVSSVSLFVCLLHQGHQGNPLCEGDTLNERDSCARKRRPDSKSLCWKV